MRKVRSHVGWTAWTSLIHGSGPKRSIGNTVYFVLWRLGCMKIFQTCMLSSLAFRQQGRTKMWGWVVSGKVRERWSGMVEGVKGGGIAPFMNNRWCNLRHVTVKERPFYHKVGLSVICHSCTSFTVTLKHIFTTILQGCHVGMEAKC